MNYKQDVQPNLSTVGTVGYCLAYARQMFTAPGGVNYAAQAWANAQFKHEDRDLPNVAVPIWFSYRGDEGHVAVYVPGQGFYSSPYLSNTSHAVLGSIDDFNQHYSSGGKYPLVYLGWTEDINGKRVAESVSAPLQSGYPLARYVGHIVNLSASAGTWRVYKVGSVSPREAIATLNPGKFGGLSYLIKSVDTSLNSVVITTAYFGDVSLPIARDNNGNLYPTATIS